MKVYSKVRGTMFTVPNVEVNKDTVYIRSNIEEINDEDFKGWEYDEVQYDMKEYVEKLTNTNDTQSIALLVSMLMSEVDFLRSRIEALEGGII